MLICDFIYFYDFYMVFNFNLLQNQAFACLNHISCIRNFTIRHRHIAYRSYKWLSISRQFLKTIRNKRRKNFLSQDLNFLRVISVGLDAAAQINGDLKLFGLYLSGIRSV